MEVRYLFLHPPDSSEILFSTPLIRAVIKSVEHAEVISAVPVKFSWLLENNPFVSSIISYEKSPSGNIKEFRDAGADYLVDLTGGTKTRWFKNRLGVMDFTLSNKKLKQIRSIKNANEAGDRYMEAGIELLSVFDLEEDGQGLDLFYGHNIAFVKRALPESFLDAYAVFDLPVEGPGERDLSVPVSELISRIERPLVLCGSEEWRLTGEEIMRKTGCTILSTCGDFNEQEQAFLRASSRVLINIESGKEIWSLVFDKPHFFVDISLSPEGWKKQIEDIRMFLKLK